MAKIISIDIGSHSINIVEAEKKNKSVKIFNTITIQTPKRAVDDGFIRNVDTISEVIKNSLLENKITSKSVVFTISSSKIVTREVTIPSVALNKVSAVINLNSSEYFPFNISDYIIDHKVLEAISEGASKELRLFIAAAPVNLMGQYSELARQLNLKLNSLDFAGNSIFQIIKRQAYVGNYMIIGLGTQSTLITIMEDNKLVIQRDIPYGTEEIYNAVMNRFGVSLDGAIEMLAQKPMLSKLEESNSNIQDEVLGAVNIVLSGVNRIIDFYNSRNQEKSFEKIYVYGSGTQILDMDKFIENFFGIPTEVRDSLINVVYDKKYLQDFNPILFVTAIGAVFEPYNLKPNIGEKVISKGEQLLYGISAGIALVALLACIIVPNMKEAGLKTEKKKLEAKIEEIKDVEDIVTTKLNLEKKLGTRIELEALSSSYTDDILDVMKSMEDNMPVNTIFVSMLINQNGIVYNTRATDMATVAKLIQQMKKVPYFSTVTTTGYSLSEQVDVFEVTTNNNGDQTRKPIGKVDLYDLSLTLPFKLPYVKLDSTNLGGE